jgi:hypothetical protein
MRTIVSEGIAYEVPEITPVSEPVMQILEGPYAGVWFTLSDMQMDEKDECVMHYNVEVAGATVDEIKPIIDNFIISLLYDRIERLKNEDKTAK